ncbi:LamG-like jellyroll fold domain-containing protein [Sedimentisphaera cyanobacteriorum]|nr:LamG-like jellyroll fold domain-containing protein [Sedimentisphaera cyanobacteriorum]
MAVFIISAASPASAVYHHWKMDAWQEGLYVDGNANTHGIADSADSSGQGSIAGNSGDPNPAHDPLYVWGEMEDPDLGGGENAFSSDAAPSGMLNGISSAQSFNFNAVRELGGNMFYAADQYGNEYSSGSFTAELFFKQIGDTSGAQTLLWAKEGHAASHLQLNTGNSGAGGLEFWGYDGSGFVNIVMTTEDRAAGFQDGMWHYAAARYNNASNEMSLMVYSEDGSAYFKNQTLTNDMIINGGNNNILIGRREGETPVERFAGLIDEVRLSGSAMSNPELIGVPEPVTALLLGIGSLAFTRKRKT